MQTKRSKERKEEKNPKGTTMPQNSIEAIRIGTSGWSYKEWEGVFYPNSKTPKLTFYSSIFNTVEIDSTFYANPSRGLVIGWVQNTPKNFEFAVKIPRTITHEKELDLRKGAEVDLLKFLDLVNPLHETEKLGPLLIQLPPSFDSQKIDKLEEFLEALPTKSEKTYKFSVEFRNKSWLEEDEKKEMISLLRKYNVTNTIVDEPLMPIDLIPTCDFAFIRWHGHGKRPWYNYRYSEKELDLWVERVNKRKEKFKDVKKIYGYFNNHFHGYAVENSLEFLTKLGIATENQKTILPSVKDRIEARLQEREYLPEEEAVSRRRATTQSKGRDNNIEATVSKLDQKTLSEF